MLNKDTSSMESKISSLISFAQSLLKDSSFFSSITEAEELLFLSLKNNGTILVCGNGGSATQASHMVGELIGRFRFNRPALPAISLFDLASTTAIGNDYGYDETFSRFVSGLGKENDVLISLSTSGNSKNCIRAIEEAKKKGLKTLSLIGRNGGIMKDISDISIVIPSDDTPTIQEFHLMIIHHLCDQLEQRFFKQ
jgi:D-sedoheptulose 7-phosphate isomerase